MECDSVVYNGWLSRKSWCFYGLAYISKLVLQLVSLWEMVGWFPKDV